MEKFLLSVIVFFSLNHSYAADLLDNVSNLAENMIADVSKDENTISIQKKPTTIVQASLKKSLNDKRFERKGDVLIDHFTNLQWQDNNANRHYSSRTNFSSAEKYCSQLILNGKSGWRLPTKAEFESAQFHINKKLKHVELNTYYWTSTKKILARDSYDNYYTFNIMKSKDDYSRTKYVSSILCIQGEINQDYNNISDKITNMYEQYFAMAEELNTEEAYTKYITNIAEENSSEKEKAVARIFEIVKKQNTVSGYTNFIKNYPYPKYIPFATEKIFELSGLKLRSTFKYGKIGERYVPSSTYSSSNPNTTTTYINGKSYTSTTYKSSSSSSGGYTSDVDGYKYLYDIKNDSEHYYLIKVRADWTGTYKKYESYRTGSWGTGDKRHRLIDQTKPSSYFETFILAPGEIYKDQFEAGEKEPNNLHFKLVNIKKLPKDYYTGLVKALNYSVSKEVKNEK